MIFHVWKIIWQNYYPMKRNNYLFSLFFAQDYWTLTIGEIGLIIWLLDIIEKGESAIDITSSPFKNQGLHCQVVIVLRGAQHNYREISFLGYGLKFIYTMLTKICGPGVMSHLILALSLTHHHHPKPKVSLDFWVPGHKSK